MLAASYPPSLFSAPYIGSWFEWTTNCMSSPANAAFPNPLWDTLSAYIDPECTISGVSAASDRAWIHGSTQRKSYSDEKDLGFIQSLSLFPDYPPISTATASDTSDTIVLTGRSHPGLNSNREKPTNHSEPGIASVIAFCNLGWTTLANTYVDLKINSCGEKSFCNLRQNSGAITISMVSLWPGGSPCPAICTSTLCKGKQPITPWRSVGRERSRSQYGFSCDVRFFHSSDRRSEPSPRSRTRIGMQRPLLQSCASSCHCFHIIN